MRSFFNLDNPLMQFLSTLTDIVILNVISLICCIPVVTIGASLTALHYVTIRMARKEEGYIIRDFFKSFRQNFIQSTVIWLLFLVISFFFYAGLTCCCIYVIPHLLNLFICRWALMLLPCLDYCK